MFLLPAIRLQQVGQCLRLDFAGLEKCPDRRDELIALLLSVFVFIMADIYFDEAGR